MRVTNSWEHPTRSTPQITRITPTHPRSPPSGQESIQKRKGSRLNLGQIERGRDEAYLIEVVGGGRHGEGELRRRERRQRQGRRTCWSCEGRRRQERRERGSLQRRGRLRRRRTGRAATGTEDRRRRRVTDERRARGPRDERRRRQRHTKTRLPPRVSISQIGRASCRERVYVLV